jgi:integrase
MSLRLKNKTYYVVYRDLRGRVNSKSLQTSNYQEALQWHALFMSRLKVEKARLSFFGDFRPAIKEDVIFAERLGHNNHRLKLTKMLEIASKKKKISPTGLKYWNNFIERISKRYKYADEITPKIALNYLESYYTSGNGKTYNNAKCYLNGIFKYCLIEAGMQQSPFAIIANRIVDPDTVKGHRNLSDEEIDKVMQVLDPDVQVLTKLSRYTTQRLETCARMTPEMFNFETKVFLIDPSKTKRFKKFVCVPIMPELEEYIKPILAKCKDADLPIAYQIRGCKERTNDAIGRHFLTRLKQCNILDSESGKASFHSLRGSAITYFKEMGVSSDELRKITGHTSDRMEDTYDRSSAQIGDLVKRLSVRKSVSQKVSHTNKFTPKN